MKNNDERRQRKLADALSMADDKYIEEASPDNFAKHSPAKTVKTVKHKSPGARIFMIAACMILSFAILVSALLIPLFVSNEEDWAGQYPVIKSKGVSSAQLSTGYTSLVEKLEAYINNKNNYDDYYYGSWDDDLEGGAVIAPGASNGAEDSPMPDAPTVEKPETNKGESSGNTYEEITDNQTSGVIESDIIKRSSKYIYYYDYMLGTLRIYSIEQQTLVGTYNLFETITEETFPEFYKNGYEGVTEFFLSKDCNSVIFVTNVRKNDAESSMLHTCFILLDVSDPANVKLKNTATVSGSLVEARYADNSFIVVTRTNFRKNNIDLENKDTYLPDVNNEYIPADSIYAPETLTSSLYTTVVSLDAQTLDVKDTLSYVSYYCNEIYVSDSNIYIYRDFYSADTNSNIHYSSQIKTEITAISYSNDKLINLGSVTVKGYLKNRYCLDEYRGVLRIAVTTERYSYYKGEDYFRYNEKISVNASLYCVRLSDFAPIAEVIAFAPEGEKVQSARFDKDNAYICTSVEFSDPVFFFDLSDLSKITYKNTGNIEGYSSSLINFGGGYLVGIGYGSNRNVLKIEVYEETDDGVESVDKYESNKWFSLEYKAYYIDRENKLIGLAVQDLYTYGYEAVYQYKVFSLNDDGSLEVIDIFSFEGSPYLGYCRGVYIDGYFYVFTPNNGFAVHKLTK